MQFFHLFSLVVAVSYAAVLPQPAGLSEKHSNNVDTNLVSILSARSYQPGLNSYKELATSTLLKRQDDSEGSSEVDSGSGSSPSPDTTPNDSEESSEVDNSGSGSSPSPDTTPNDSEESSEVDSGSGSSPSPDTTPNDSEESSEVDSGSGSSPSPDTTPNDSEESSEVDSGSDSSPSPDTTPNDSEESSEVDSGSGSSPSPDTTPNDSEESSEVDSGSGSSPSPDTTPEKKFSLPFTEETVSSMALASTINNVGDGIVGFYEDAEKAGQRLRGDAGDLLAKYLRRALYVNTALRNWADNFVPGILLTVKSGSTEKRYFKAGPRLIKSIRRYNIVINRGQNRLLGATSNLADDVGPVTKNLKAIKGLSDSVILAPTRRYLMLARMDALWTARKAIQIGILVDTHPFSVDHCILCDQQLLSTSIAHLVVECEQVAGHRIQSGLVPAIQKSRLRLLGRALDPGVENVYTWLRGGVLNGEADLDQLLVGRDCGA
ncbi:hypothetical protein BASA50_006508 [Batrachochytrium salamandrivorans]|uniref:Uncharacterized protein n=1 Tax=Batrachochytrium salamandrivorans TaxID=1357716 RepID=A0ABQ8F9M8_9FUNG|nr:hypothetical protein BASA50_006508 [Batrachochytrium salamandrivorans]